MTQQKIKFKQEQKREELGKKFSKQKQIKHVSSFWRKNSNSFPLHLLSTLIIKYKKS